MSEYQEICKLIERLGVQPEGISEQKVIQALNLILDKVEALELKQREVTYEEGTGSFDDGGDVGKRLRSQDMVL